MERSGQGEVAQGKELRAQTGIAEEDLV